MCIRDRSYPLVWGMVIAAFSLLPIIGPRTVYFPMSLYYLLTQDYMTGFFLLLFGVIFLDVIPGNVIRPRLAMKGASIHPVNPSIIYCTTFCYRAHWDNCGTYTIWFPAGSISHENESGKKHTQ